MRLVSPNDLPVSYEDLAALHRDVGDRGIAHDDLGRRPVELHERGLVDQHLDVGVCGVGEKGCAGGEGVRP